MKIIHTVGGIIIAVTATSASFAAEPKTNAGTKGAPAEQAAAHEGTRGRAPTQARDYIPRAATFVASGLKLGAQVGKPTPGATLPREGSNGRIRTVVVPYEHGKVVLEARSWVTGGRGRANVWIANERVAGVEMNDGLKLSGETALSAANLELGRPLHAQYRPNSSRLQSIKFAEGSVTMKNVDGQVPRHWTTSKVGTIPNDVVKLTTMARTGPIVDSVRAQSSYGGVPEWLSASKGGSRLHVMGGTAGGLRVATHQDWFALAKRK